MPSNKPTCLILDRPQDFPVAAKASREGHRRYNCPHPTCKPSKPEATSEAKR